MPLHEPGRFLIYAPLRHAAFVGNSTIVNFLAELRQGVEPEVADLDPDLIEFLRRLEILDSGPEEPPITSFVGEPSPTCLTLFLTTSCNLRCTYCYASAGDSPVRSMSTATATRGVDFVIENAGRRASPGIEVVYHGGGEPTLNWKTLTESWDYARRRASDRGLAATASCATNGVLPDAKVDWILRNLEGLTVSMDGVPATHDRHRRTRAGHPSSHRVIRTLKRLDAAGFPYAIRVTVTEDQIESLPVSIEYLCTEFAARRIQVEPAYSLGRWESAPSSATTAFLSAYREARTRAHRAGRDLGFSGVRVGQLSNHFCGVTQDSFALTPDGNVSACYEVFSEDARWADKFFYGRAATEHRGYEFEPERVDHLRRQAVQHRAFCQGCFAKWTCAGDCYHKVLMTSGTGDFQGSDRCHLTRELTKDELLIKVAASGGLFWHPVQHE